MHINQRDDAAVVDHSLDGESRLPQIVAFISVFGTLSVLVVSLRVYGRAFILRLFGYDDAIMIGGLMLNLGYGAAIACETHYGLGRHAWVQPDSHMVPYMKSFYASIVLYNLSMCLIKISILLQYRRIFTIGIMHTATTWGASFMAVWAFVLALVLPLSCIPAEAFWNDSVVGHCVNLLIEWYVMASVNVATDIITFLFVVPVIRSLQMQLRQKLAVFSIFSLGLVTCAFSITRIHTLKSASETSDSTWTNVDAALWSWLESNIAILAACLPTLRPVLSKCMPRLFGSSMASASAQTGPGGHVQLSDRMDPGTSSETLGRVSENTFELQKVSSQDTMELNYHGSEAG